MNHRNDGTEAAITQRCACLSRRSGIRSVHAALQQVQDLPVHGLVAGDDVARLHACAPCPARSVTKPPASRTIDHAGGEIPRRKAALPIDVEPAGRHIGEIERGRAEAPQPGDLVLDRRHFAAEQREIAAPVMRQRAAHDRVGEPLARRDADAAVVEERALAALGGEELVVGGIVDQPRDDLALALERDRDRRSAGCRAGSWWCRRADRRSRCWSCRCPRACRLPRRESRSPAAPSSSSVRRISSARWSAAETKFAGPFSETCRFSTSPKSRLRLRPALRAAAIITLSRADWAGTWYSRRRRWAAHCLPSETRIKRAI